MDGNFTELVVDGSPEKAGVGGSIPSLATIKSISYRASKSQIHSVSFQKLWSAETRISVETWRQDCSEVPSIPPQLWLLGKKERGGRRRLLDCLSRAACTSASVMTPSTHEEGNLMKDRQRSELREK